MAAPIVSKEYLQEIEKARRDLRALIYSKNCAPIMFRMAWHDAGTYDARTRNGIPGGPNGSIRNTEELNHSANKGLETAVQLCEEVKAKHPKITYADLYQLAGVVAVEIAGGPSINFVPGRKDSNQSPPEGRLPDARLGASRLREVFYRMGLSDKDIVVLSGGHTLDPERSGFEGASEVRQLIPQDRGDPGQRRARGLQTWTKEPWKFDNSYPGTEETRTAFPAAASSFVYLTEASPGAAPSFVYPTDPSPFTLPPVSQDVLTKEPWNPGRTKKPWKFDNSYFVKLLKEQREGLLQFQTDKALVEDPVFRRYVELYAKDNDAFFRDYAVSHKKLSELGFSPPSSAPKVVVTLTIVAAIIVGLVYKKKFGPRHEDSRLGQ